VTSPGSYVRLVPWIAVGIAALAALHFLDTASLLTAQLERIRGLGPWGPVAFIALYVLATVLFLPGSVLTLGAGVVFGVVQGSVTR
jgi:uncharacterized membrane protein YdjX (TVP38/TMEM64 family)